MKRVRIKPVRGTNLAENKDEARSIREDDILPALERGEDVELDFRDVEIATQSYVHALISDAVRRYGEDTFDRLRFSNCSESVRQIVVTVFEYTLTAAEQLKDTGAGPRASLRQSDGQHRLS
jgi:hypothetical protein